jgi:hypothetical protein
VAVFEMGSDPRPGEVRTRHPVHEDDGWSLASHGGDDPGTVPRGH